MAKTKRKLIDLTGQVFGRLTVCGEGPQKRRNNGKTRRRWMCKCTCGNSALIPQDNLLKGKSKSCGCYRVDFTRHVKTIHGLCGTPEYSAWIGIKERCLNPHGLDAAHYKDRGITMCHQYQSEFVAFFRDIGRRPNPQHSVDRIDNNGHYSCGKCPQCAQNGWPLNIRWASRETQNNNTRRNHFLTVNGQTLTIAQWARRMNIKSHVLDNRLRDGWSHAQTVLTPVRYMRPFKRA